MSSPNLRLIDLPWLPRRAPDFKARLDAAVAATDRDWGPALRGLATQFLEMNQSIALSKALATLRARGKSKALTRFRLGIVSNATTKFVAPFLEAAALRHGIDLEVIGGEFGQVMQEAVDPQSALNQARPDAILVAVDHRGLPFRSGDQAAWPPYDPAAALAEVDAICAAFQKNSGAVCIVQTLPAPPQLVFGSLDAAMIGTLRSSIARFNAELATRVVARGDVLVDVDWLAQSVGLDHWYDARFWYLARLPFAQGALPLYADFVARAIAAIRGKARKCLILDLDNTLWGGVIGDDGLDGIALDEGDARGEAHRAVQQVASDLRKRGVVLAVCSKNEDDIARTPFRSHPGMILKENDIAVFLANWDDKATNIERIAERLDLGLDAMVLLDDNPVERAQVRAVLPEVAVPELGEDPSTYAGLLLAAGYFESVAFTAEDLARAEQYKGNADRWKLKESARDMDEFLRSLEMEIRLVPFDAIARKRITQLINKTNQFNVTTRRYTEKQVAALETSGDHYTLQYAVRDRFGDNGIIGAVICATGGDSWRIDTWLMSCRVLNRKIEEAVCNRLAADAKRAGARRIVGEIIATERNRIAQDLYRRLGFEAAGEADGASQWILDLERFTPFVVPVVEAREPVSAG